VGARPPSSFLSQSGVLVLTNGLSAVASTAYVSLTGRRLGPEDYGDVAAALSLAYLFALVLGPIETGISKFAATYHGDEERGRLASLVYGGLQRVRLPLVITLVASLPFMLLAQGWLHLPHVGVLAGVTVYTAFSLLASIPRGVQRGDHRFFDYGFNQVAESLLRLGIGAAALWLGLGAAGAIAGYAAGMGAAFALAMWQLRDLGGVPRLPIDRRSLYEFSVPLLLVYVYFLSVVNLDMLVAKRNLPDVESGLYGAASTLTRLMYLVATPIYQVLFSRVSTQRAQGRSSRRLVIAVIGVIAAGLVVGYAIPWFFGEEVLALVFGDRYRGGAPILRIMWLTTSLLVLQSIGVFVLLGVDRTRGAWALLIPCGLLVGLLWQFHGSATEVAWCSLAAVACGTLVVAAMLALPRRA
jgi:O-antigen/teichoic acid export membrane protein